MVFPGPNAIQCRAIPSQVDETESQSLPESIHFGPFKFGDASPRLAEAKAATKGPYQLKKTLIKIIPQYTQY